MFSDTVQSGQVGVNLSGEPMRPEAGVSEVELSPFSGLKPWRWRPHVPPKHLARLHGVRPADRNVSVYGNGNKSWFHGVLLSGGKYVIFTYQPWAVGKLFNQFRSFKEFLKSICLCNKKTKAHLQICSITCCCSSPACFRHFCYQHQGVCIRNTTKVPTIVW